MISVICPVYNEEKYIEKVIQFCLNAEPKEKEIFFIDGASQDNTRDIICKYIKSSSGKIILLDNPNRYVSFALNEAIKAAKGDIIIRIDAHTDYDKDYFSNILKTFKRVDADIVGGAYRIAVGSNTQQAIGYAISTSFGIGNSSNHFEEFEGYTDSVAYGAWKKEIFATTGLFDTQMKRNQDDEFHYRAKSRGFKIYQSPDIKLYYHPRNSLKKLFRQYYEYGLYKPLVLKKVKQEVKIRHLIPSLFCLYLISLIAAMLIGWYWYSGFLGLYILLDFYFAIKSKKSWAVKLIILLVYPTLHLAYGSGFILGINKKVKANNNA
jgi:succinoglycan biosynthesis protein ExoA